MDKIITCPSGWEKIYMPIVNKILEHDSEKNNVSSKIGIDKVYEEDGSLKISVVNEENLTSELKNLILEARKKSLNTCSFCGSTSEVGTTMNSNYITCCKSCWMKNILPINENSIWKCFETNKYFKKNKNNG